MKLTSSCSTALQADADRTNVQLARLTGLSPAATLHRVRALKESGVIRIIRAHVDPEAAGFALQVYVTATLTRHDPRYERIFEDQVRALPQVISADNIAGETDYLLSIVARDVTELPAGAVAADRPRRAAGDLPAAGARSSPRHRCPSSPPRRR